MFLNSGISLEYFAVANCNLSNGYQTNSNPLSGYYTPTYYNHIYELKYIKIMGHLTSITNSH